jgi:hypothetical protein
MKGGAAFETEIEKHAAALLAYWNEHAELPVERWPGPTPLHTKAMALA